MRPWHGDTHTQSNVKLFSFAHTNLVQRTEEVLSESSGQESVYVLLGIGEVRGLMVCCCFLQALSASWKAIT